MGKRKRKPKLHYDERGEFRWETYFVGGKQKRSKVRTVDGIDAEEFWRQNADPIALHQAGEWHVLHELETRGNQGDDGEISDAIWENQESDGDIDIPF